MDCNSVQESSDIGRTFIHLLVLNLCNFHVETGTSQREAAVPTHLFLVCSQVQTCPNFLASFSGVAFLSTAAHSSPGTVFHTWPDPLARAVQSSPKLVHAWSKAIAHSFHRCHSRLA